jgi:Putative sensor
MTAVAVRRAPLRNFAGPGPWLATAYLFSYLPTGLVFFCCGLAVAAVCVALAVTWLALPLLVGAAGLLRGAAHVERRRAALVGEKIEPAVRRLGGPGLLAMIRAAWRDAATWRACAYMVPMFPLLFVMDVGVLMLWLVTLAGVTVPAWYSSVSMRLPDGTETFGLWLGYPVDTLPVALLTAAGFAVLALAAAYLVIGAALLHRAVAKALLGPPVDPLDEAKRMLAEPGPLDHVNA